MQTTPDTVPARPVVALMGEFSAGKSTLANLLIGEGVSPVRVTATQLPPIWYSHGDGHALSVDHDGNATELDLGALDGVSVDETAYIKVFLEVDVLELMDIIDMPGISDPNLSSKTWEQIIPHADSVIWCSHATQAWRQSEAATWSEMPVILQQNSLLLLTRFDKILTETDRSRVLSRVESETDGLFAGVYPISLLQAAEAEDDRNAWEDSGAEAFTQKLLDVVFNLPPRQTNSLSPPHMRVHEDALVVEQPKSEPRAAEPHLAVAQVSVTPKRVVPGNHRQSRRERLPRSALNVPAF
ncbi:dynamin family protein [Tropicimonas marinistellae]|uniref:dynamin family protein n=1 Tax=Tropicimonas marinistellae TaxID=1739787 RepID=UPI00082CD149|nr:dynamin family protein [Tropicimonas marinistellae]